MSSRPAITFEVKFQTQIISDFRSMRSSDSGIFNLVVLMGPEQPISVLSDQLEGINWDGTGVGFGVRGSPLQNLTVRLEGKYICPLNTPSPFSLRPL